MHTSRLPIRLSELRSQRLLLEVRSRGPSGSLFSLPSLEDVAHDPDTDGDYQTYQGDVFEVILAGVEDW